MGQVDTETAVQATHGHTRFPSVVLFDWCLFACAIMLFFILHMLVLGRLSTNGWHLTVLMIWLMVGFAYNTVIWLRFGADVGISWFVGYLLEFIFLVENVFIFQILIQAFKTPAKLTTKALHFVVWGQIAFEMVFFMGLAAWLRSFKALPYLLGIWLIFFGYVAARGGPAYEVDIMETRACRAFTWVLGERLSPQYEKDGRCLLYDVSGKLRVSLLGLVISMLLLADFLLEIDVVLVKIEELPNPYIAFTSSAVAAFSIPELFFVSKGLLKQFVMLKYGIAAVLTLFGTQLLLSSFYVVRPVVACFIIVFVLATCVLASALISCCGVDERHSELDTSMSADSLVSSGSPHRGRSPRQPKRPRENPKDKDSVQVPTCDDADTAAGLNRAAEPRAKSLIEESESSGRK
jgi:predicted tellurium resistance membrane protein TerC